MKRFLSILLILALLLSVLPAQSLAADSTVTYDGVVYQMGSLSGSVVGFTEDLPADVVILPEIDGVPVRAIADWAFKDCKLIRSIVIPDSITAIRSLAFYRSSLSGIVDMPASVSIIDDYAFDESDVVGVRFQKGIVNWKLSHDQVVIVVPRESLPGPNQYAGNKVYLAAEDVNEEYLQSYRYTQDGIEYIICKSFAAVIAGKDEASVTIPEQVQGVPVTQILDFSFQSNRNLTTLKLPQTIESIGKAAFNATNLSTFTAPKALRTIGASAFFSSPNLRSVDLTGVEVIGASAFSQCSYLSSLKLGSSVVSIGDSAFSSCPLLASVTLPESLRELGSGVFYDDAAITAIRLPDSLETLGGSAFAMTGISSITIPGSVRELPELSFSEMPKLTSVTLAEGLESIGKNAFYNCPKLRSITLPASVKTVSAIPDMADGTVYYHTGTSFDINNPTYNTITFVNLDTGDRRPMFYTYWDGNLGYLICQDHVKLVKCGAEPVTEMVIPEEIQGLPVTEIGSRAIASYYLQNVTLPSTLKTIGQDAFYDCPFLCGLVLPPSVTYCGTEEKEATIYNRQLPDDRFYIETKDFYIIAEAGSYGVQYADRMGYRLFVPTATRSYVLQDNHVFAIENGEAALAASHPLRNGDVDVVPGYVNDMPVTRVLTDAYTNHYRAGTYSGAFWDEPLEVIEDHAFPPNTDPMVLLIPPTVTEIGDEAFGDWYHQTIYGFVDSYAQEYAEAHGHEFYDATDLLPFEDVDPDAWYFPAVKYCYWNGLMNGTSETTFAPSATTTRAMLVQVFFNIAGDPEYVGAAHFADVPNGAWFAQAVNWAYENDITSGTSATTFSPNAPVTREQVATFLYNFSKALDLDTSARADLSGYRDARSVSAWARDAMEWCVAEGIITGTDSTTLSPGSSATRAQIATILMRFTEE